MTTTNNRNRLHQSRVAQVASVQVVTGRGQRARVDHEATLLERARLLSYELSSHEVTERGLESLDRLLRRIEEGKAAQAQDVRSFIDAIWNNKPLDLLLLRGVDAAVADDMVAVLDAHRYARFNLVEQVEGGPRRVTRALAVRTGTARLPLLTFRQK